MQKRAQAAKDRQHKEDAAIEEKYRPIMIPPLKERLTQAWKDQEGGPKFLSEEELVDVARMPPAEYQQRFRAEQMLAQQRQALHNVDFNMLKWLYQLPLKDLAIYAPQYLQAQDQGQQQAPQTQVSHPEMQQQQASQTNFFHEETEWNEGDFDPELYEDPRRSDQRSARNQRPSTYRLYGK